MARKLILIKRRKIYVRALHTWNKNVSNKNSHAPVLSIVKYHRVIGGYSGSIVILFQNKSATISYTTYSGTLVISVNVVEYYG